MLRSAHKFLVIFVCLFVRNLLIRAHHCQPLTFIRCMQSGLVHACTAELAGLNMLLLKLSFLLSHLVSGIAQSPQLFPSGPLPQAYDAPGSCAAGSEFYQSGNLSCVACGGNQQTAPGGKGPICLACVGVSLQLFSCCYGHLLYSK